MPLPSELTTPPVTKMYFVELTDSPPSSAGSSGFPRTGDRPPCPRRAPPGPRTAPRRSGCRATAGAAARAAPNAPRSEEHTSELQSQSNLVCRLLLEKKKNHTHQHSTRRSRQHLLRTLPEPFPISSLAPLTHIRHHTLRSNFTTPFHA